MKEEYKKLLEKIKPLTGYSSEQMRHDSAKSILIEFINFGEYIIKVDDDKIRFDGESSFEKHIELIKSL